MPRAPIIGGNFKCNGTTGSLQQLVSDFDADWRSGLDGVEVVLCPSAVHLQLVQKLVTARGASVAAQNCIVKGGAFTGEISAAQVRDLGVPWVVLGHSERRTIYKETDEVIGEKVKAALANGLSVIACIGETLAERESGDTLTVCFRQMDAIAKSVSDWSRVVIAYEPVWAIGTGKVATPEQAQDVHLALRNWLSANVSSSVANSTRIQYGGSVNAKNCAALWSKPDIDGFLVGGASLKPEFKTIVQAAKRPKSKL
eukprot:TRINITY_DN1745_c0_g2_i1.p2 TRINITY_DN1745_c0_g2~~TRINITY_DN1745_c0_g2_i1.p2  ORF type:complete len:256 (+),score=92.94 TRINITY_DN1745_c0_g2_i1:84-851(+)